MTGKRKLLVGAAVCAAGAVAVVLWRRRKDPTGTVTLSEYAVVDCNCFRVDYKSDGTSTSTKVPRLWCELDGLGANFTESVTGGQACPDDILSRLFG